MKPWISCTAKICFDIHHLDLENPNLCLVKQAAQRYNLGLNGEEPVTKMFCCLHKVLDDYLRLDRVEVRLEDHVFVVYSDILTAPCWLAISFIRSHPEIDSKLKSAQNGGKVGKWESGKSRKEGKKKEKGKVRNSLEVKRGGVFFSGRY